MTQIGRVAYQWMCIDKNTMLRSSRLYSVSINLLANKLLVASRPQMTQESLVKVRLGLSIIDLCTMIHSNKIGSEA